MTRYGDLSTFLRTFAMSNTQTYTSNEIKQKRCVYGSAPSLAVVANAYGDQVAHNWMYDLVVALAIALGQTFTVEQAESIVQAFLSEHSDLKVTDWMLFSVKVRAGTFGSMYGQCNPARLGEMVQQYRQWRNGVIEQCAREEAHKRAEDARQAWAQNGITMEEYLKQKDVPPTARAFAEKIYYGKNNPQNR